MSECVFPLVVLWNLRRVRRISTMAPCAGSSQRRINVVLRTKLDKLNSNRFPRWLGRGRIEKAWIIHDNDKGGKKITEKRAYIEFPRWLSGNQPRKLGILLKWNCRRFCVFVVLRKSWPTIFSRGDPPIDGSSRKIRSEMQFSLSLSSLIMTTADKWSMRQMSNISPWKTNVWVFFFRKG